MELYVLENGYPSSGKHIPWDELGIDVSSACTSIGTAQENYQCTSTLFTADAPMINPYNWYLDITPNSNFFGNSPDWENMESHSLTFEI